MSRGDKRSNWGEIGAEQFASVKLFEKLLSYFTPDEPEYQQLLAIRAAVHERVEEET